MHHVGRCRGRHWAWDTAQPKAGMPACPTLGSTLDIGSDEWSQLLIAGARAFGLELTPAQTRVFAGHAAELVAWNRVTNLTTVTAPRPMALTHHLDSLAPASLIPENAVRPTSVRAAASRASPCTLPLAGLRTTLIDASRKKVSFLRHAIRELRLEPDRSDCTPVPRSSRGAAVSMGGMT